MKYLFLLSFIFPGIALAAPDLSDCENIGHRIGDYTPEKNCDFKDVCLRRVSETCVSVDECDESMCDSAFSSAAECDEYIKAKNQAVEENSTLYRCPRTDTRISWLAGAPQTRFAGFITNDGLELSVDELVADDAHVYIHHGAVNVLDDFFNRGKDIFYILGRPDADGLYLIAIPE